MCIVLYLHLGLPGRVCHVPELLPRPAFRGGARLHVPAPVVPHPVPHPQPPVRLRLRLDNPEAEGGNDSHLRQLARSHTRTSKLVPKR